MIYFAKVFSKWAVLVSINAIAGFSLGYPSNGEPGYIIGMLLAIFSWVIIYSSLELYLARRAKRSLIRALYLGALIRALLQCVVFIDIWAGILAGAIIEVFSLPTHHFLGAYLQTMMTGALLSLLVALFPFIVVLKAKLMSYKK